NGSGATVVSVTASPSTGDVLTGAQVTLTLAMSKPVTVSGGTPSLTLNDGGTAALVATINQTGGTQLVFGYTVQSAQSTTALAVTGFNPNGATIQDTGGIAANFAGATAAFSSLEINWPPPGPTVLSVTATPNSGTLLTSASDTLTVNMTQAVTVVGGPPTLTLNDLGSATYNAALSSPSALVFNYTVLSGQVTSALGIQSFNTNGATIQSTTGVRADMSGAQFTFINLAVNFVNSSGTIGSGQTGTVTAGGTATGTIV